MGLLDTLSSVTTAATTLSNIMLVNPQDVEGIEAQVNGGLSGLSVSDLKNPTFVFDYEGENTVLLESDITDHVIEDNTSIQDQVALKPETITTHGFVGELNDIVPDVTGYDRIIVEKLLLMSVYTPEISVTGLMIYNRLVQGYQIAKLAAAAAVSAWNTLGGSSNPITSALGEFANQNKQQKAFLLFYGYWKNRTLFTIKTPWAKFDDMAIKSLRAVQDSDTRVVTDFEITFKKMKFAKTISTDSSVFGQGRFMNQIASLSNNGKFNAVSDVGLFDSTSPGKGLLGF